MGTTNYAAPPALWGTAMPTVWQPRVRPSRFGDIAITLFLVAQCLDGVFTYVGVMTFGLAIEANPLISGLIVRFGEAPALLGAKIVASGLGIALHLREVHRVVALLTVFYFAAAVLPWSAILFL